MITPTGISSPSPGTPQRIQACPSAWAQVNSRLLAEWQAIITMWLRTLAACTMPTVQPAYDAAGSLPSAGMAPGADRAAKEAYIAVEGDVRAVLARPAGGCQLRGCPGSCGQLDLAPENRRPS